MPTLPLPPPASPATGVQVGLLVASAKVPETLAPSLLARSTLDQGIVTGLATGIHYLVTVATQDILQAAAAKLARFVPQQRPLRPVDRRRLATFGVDLLAVPVGLAIQRAVRPRPNELPLRGLVRQAGWRVAVTGAGGAIVLAAQTGTRVADWRLGARGRLAAVPLAVPVGLGIAYVLDRRRAAAASPDSLAEASAAPSMLRSFGVAGGVVGGLAAVAFGEHVFAGAVGRALASVLPGGPQFWKIAGHGAALAALGGAGYAVYARAIRRIEVGTSAEEPFLDNTLARHRIGPTLSGGANSSVPWSTLGREGRRHALAYVRPQPQAHRPAGIPDLSIETVMREPATATPVQVYVGLDSAKTPRERVDLALGELDRTGAFDRSLLMLVSPTGTGYVNYCAVAAAQYLTRGDVATVTLQYSKRPSPLSLGKLSGAREQNRMLWLQILRRLRDRPGRRPRVVLFGESLGAHTSQDVFLHWGTLGPDALGIDRALWIGTPYASGWMHEVTGPDRLDVDRAEVVVVNDFAQLAALAPERRSRLRYVLVSHDNDGVTKFGLDLIATPPSWLGDDRPLVESVPGASPRGVSRALRWRPVTTFLQTLIDMKNAQAPGAYRAFAHDYRPDLARFVSEVFDLPATPDQLARIEAALKERETVRERLFAAASSGPGEGNREAMMQAPTRASAPH